MTTTITSAGDIDAGRSNSRTDAAMPTIFQREEVSREWLAFCARAISLAIISIWLTTLMPWEETLFYLPLILAFIGCGYGHYRVTAYAPHWTWARLLLIAFDFGLLAFTTTADNPLNDWTLPPPLRLESGNFGFFFVILSSVGLSYSTRRTVVTGLIAGIAWASVYLWVAQQPGSFTYLDTPLNDVTDWIAARENFNFVDLHGLYQDLMILTIVTGILALSVHRSRRLVLEQAQLARERSNLARYFPPNMVDSLAGRDEPLGSTRTQPVAVLFADIVGFTEWAEQHSPGEVIGLLREVHAKLEAAVFEHDGTLDKYLGDGLMATFGTPRRGPRDAANAIACAQSMVSAIDAWSAAQTEPNRIRLSVGIQYGEVVIGDIGSARRMEFTVLGDTVNVASRLEAATRELGCRILIGEPVVTAACEESHLSPADLLPTAARYDSIKIKGHTAIGVYAL